MQAPEPLSLLRSLPLFPRMGTLMLPLAAAWPCSHDSSIPSGGPVRGCHPSLARLLQVGNVSSDCSCSPFTHPLLMLDMSSSLRSFPSVPPTFRIWACLLPNQFVWECDTQLQQWYIPVRGCSLPSKVSAIGHSRCLKWLMIDIKEWGSSEGGSACTTS